jgi:hypothetical protein
MTERRWIASTILTIFALVAVNLAFCYASDPYGLLRDPKQRRLSIYCADRKAKFLMSKHYVPANFDGLLLGPSSSSNWDLSGIRSTRIYNESVLGGNVSEEKRIAEQALAAGHFHLAVCVLTPKMTSSHTMRDGLDTVTAREALGSIHAFTNAAATILLAMHINIGKSVAPPNGTRPIKEETILDTPVFADSSYDVDPVALRDYRTLVLSLQRQGAKILYVKPPLYEPCYEKNRAGLTRYLDLITKEMPPALVIDFNGSQFTSLQSNRGYFVDCLHLNAAGARQVSALLTQLIPAALASADGSTTGTIPRQAAY